MQNSIIPKLFVSDITFLSADEKHVLLESIDNDTNLEAITVNDIRSIVGRNVRPKIWDTADMIKRAERAQRWMHAVRVDFIMDSDEYYPPLLKEVPDRPFALFCRGDKKCLTGRFVSIVGTRHVTPMGSAAAEQFARDASLDGVSVVSGLALGVDGAAHKGAVRALYDAMENGESAPLGKSVAVLPCGVDIITPSRHKHLAQNIIYTGGTIISEYLPGTEAEAWRFVSRNRIIAGMSNATLVIEAPPGSGALITARHAMEYNRMVMFHKAAVSDQAREVAEYVKEQLEIQVAQGKVSRAKIESTSQKYIDDGAPIIKDYADFCECLCEAPGERTTMNEDIINISENEGDQ